HDEDSFWVAAEIRGMVVGPAQGLRHVADNLPHLDGRQEPVVDGNEDESLFHEHLRLDLHVFLVTGLPAAAMNPEDDRPVLRVRGVVDIEHLKLVALLDVGDVALDFLSWCAGRECEDSEKCYGMSHEISPLTKEVRAGA